MTCGSDGKLDGSVQSVAQVHSFIGSNKQLTTNGNIKIFSDM